MERGKAVTSAFIFVTTTISSIFHHSNNHLLVSPCFLNICLCHLVFIICLCHLVFKVVMVSTTAAIAKGEAGVLKAEMIMFYIFFILFVKVSCEIVCKEMPNIEEICSNINQSITCCLVVKESCEIVCWV